MLIQKNFGTHIENNLLILKDRLMRKPKSKRVSKKE